MHIGIITPAGRLSLNGNRATAQRWANILMELGARVDISTEWDGSAYDVMLALHAWRSANSIAQFKAKYPNAPLLLAMTGTDLYQYINSHAQPTLASIEMADRIVTLHDLAGRVLPQSSRHKVHVIHQSAKELPQAPRRSVKTFDICVAGHLREEKDSLRAALAVRDLPSSSKIRVMHYGKAHNDEWGGYAKQEMQSNSRYHWLGEVPHWKVRQAYARSHLMVLPSVMEGGANVISEAVVAGLPVIASEIDGSVGLLGVDYAGYFPARDTRCLRKLLLRAESEAGFLKQLEDQCAIRKPLFTRVAEKQAWKNLLNDL